MSHSASVSAFSKATNSNAIVKRVVTVYLNDFQDTTLPPSVITCPLVNFNSSKSEIQLASEYPSKTERKSQYGQIIINSSF